MKRTLIFICGTMLAAVACLAILVAVSGMPNAQKNGFNRKWLTITVHPQLSQPLPFTAERLFGAGDDLYLSEPSHRRVYRLDNNLRISDTVNLNIDKALKPPVNFFATGDHIYVHEYNSGMLFYKGVHAAAFDSVKLSAGPYVKSLQLSDSLVVIRGFSNGGFQPVFMRINTRSGEQRKSALLSGKADAGFSSDGILCSTPQQDRLLYIPYFENGIYCMDSDMQLRYQQHTIDTVFNSGIQVASTGEGDMKKLYASAPRVKVNKRAFANGQFLFIESDLRADNEEENAFSEHPVLDAYRLQDGSYTGSFYLPVDKRKVLSYHINDKKLYVLLKDQVIACDLNL
ncbi:hypothetical protein F0L74_29380 [Chitinophaga agrisoli]|uniref:TolB-like protein n=1 Tax=Chitinophaga agrisoli TaxID=2607653 RepID=A0A5B2VQA0_9BACT|nr:hypothetical protein [Chitinophaga agrisoli]KAA2240279.1 hypothetical protein F0L74_29380 [Chitinophaga agrisoli]